MREWFRWESHAILKLLPRIPSELSVDCLITGPVLAAGGSVAEKLGRPYLTVCTAPPLNEDIGLPPPFTSWNYADSSLARIRNRIEYVGWRWFSRPTREVINRYRKRCGLRRLARLEDAYSPFTQITQLLPQFDFPGSQMPPPFHYVGSLSADRAARPQAFPWEHLGGRPVIFASLRTIADTLNGPVYPKIAAACEGLDAQLILARGKWDDEECGRKSTDQLAGNSLAVDFSPQRAILEWTAVIVTHAEISTTLEVIRRAVPTVALPRGADQPANAARILYSGAGLAESFYRDSPHQIRKWVSQVLMDGLFRDRSQSLKRAMQRAGGARRTADSTEQVLITHSPVTQSKSDSVMDAPAHPGG